MKFTVVSKGTYYDLISSNILLKTTKLQKYNINEIKNIQDLAPENIK
jgi:hypothetical protein